MHTANGTQPNFAKREEVSGADASRMRWRRVVNLNKTIEIDWVADVPEPENIFGLTMASRRAAFRGNTSLIAKFSSYCNLLVL